MDAKTTVSTRYSNSCREQLGASHSNRAASRWRSREPHLQLVKSSCVETLRALLRKLGYTKHVAEPMTSTFRPSSINLYKNQMQRITVETPYSTIPYTTIFYITRWTHGPQNLQRPIRTLIVLLVFLIKQISCNLFVYCPCRRL